MHNCYLLRDLWACALIHPTGVQMAPLFVVSQSSARSHSLVKIVNCYDKNWRTSCSASVDPLGVMDPWMKTPALHYRGCNVGAQSDHCKYGEEKRNDVKRKQVLYF